MPEEGSSFSASIRNKNLFRKWPQHLLIVRTHSDGQTMPERRRQPVGCCGVWVRVGGRQARTCFFLNSSSSFLAMAFLIRSRHAPET